MTRVLNGEIIVEQVLETVAGIETVPFVK